MQPLTNPEIEKLKARAQRLRTMFKVGKAGLSDAFVSGLKDALALHELIKVKFAEFKEEKKTLAPALAEKDRQSSHHARRQRCCLLPGQPEHTGSRRESHLLRALPALPSKPAAKSLLFDPFIRPESPRPRHQSQLTADYILISHAHDTAILDDAVYLAKTHWRHGYHAVLKLRNGSANRASPAFTAALNHGGGFNFDCGRVKFVNAIHSSSLPDSTYGSNPGGAVGRARPTSGNFYYSGDTALTQDMKLIGESTVLAIAVLCIGDNFTMGVDDAIKAMIHPLRRDYGRPLRHLPTDPNQPRRRGQKIQAAGKRISIFLASGRATPSEAMCPQSTALISRKSFKARQIGPGMPPAEVLFQRGNGCAYSVHRSV